MTDVVPPGGTPGEETSGSPAAGAGRTGATGHDHLRASDADRDRVAEHLRDAMAEGRLDMDEFQERLETTYRARTYGELAPITRDLPSAAPGGVDAGVAPVSMAKTPAPAGDGPDWPARVGGAPTSSWAFAFFGGFQRKGRWTVSRLFTAFAMLGGGEIDLRDASFEDRDTTIRCFTIMGGVQVTAPPGLNVQVSGFGIMGGFGDDHRSAEDGDPDAPRVKVTGFALMGGVGVERKVTRAEKLRLKEERRQLREEHRQGRLDARTTREEHHGDRRHELEGHRDRREARREFRREIREDRRGRYGPDGRGH
jgi:hypothetical protein